MKLVFSNKCRYKVYIEMGSNSEIEIQPYDSVCVFCNKADKIIINVRRDAVSHKHKSDYILVLKTRYTFKNVKDNTEFTITREKVKIDFNIYYDRLFLSSGEDLCVGELNEVIDVNGIKKRFNKARRRYTFFISPLENSTDLVVLLIIIGIVLTYIKGVKVAMIYFPIAYIMLLLFNTLMTKSAGVLFRKLFDQKDEKKEFNKYCESEFIDKYYLNPDLTPFKEKVEVN